MSDRDHRHYWPTEDTRQRVAGNTELIHAHFLCYLSRRTQPEERHS